MIRLLRQLAANARVYDKIQMLVGARRLQERLAKQMQNVQAESSILDIGGGTGLLGRICPPDARYMCLDLDMQKLARYVQRYEHPYGILADATRIPLLSDSIDAVLCTFMSHHVTDNSLHQIIEESLRVLRKGGRFIFMDAVWNPANRIGRLLWRLDRGEYPKSPEMLQSSVSRFFEVQHEESISIYHDYLLLAGVKKAA